MDLLQSFHSHLLSGNTIKINNSDDLEWYVGDSNMEELIDFIKEKGIKIEAPEKENHLQPGQNVDA